MTSVSLLFIDFVSAVKKTVFFCSLCGPVCFDVCLHWRDLVCGETAILFEVVSRPVALGLFVARSREAREIFKTNFSTKLAVIQGLIFIQFLFNFH